jgi:short-subunit dehydrogenase
MPPSVPRLKRPVARGTLFNNAGLMTQGIFETITVEQARDMSDLNIFCIQRATVRCSLQCAKPRRP